MRELQSMLSYVLIENKIPTDEDAERVLPFNMAQDI